MIQQRMSVIALLLLSTTAALGNPAQAVPNEVNRVAAPRATQRLAIRGATLIDGRGGPPVQDSVVLIEENRIEAVGRMTDLPVPDGFETIDAGGLTLLPGFIDAHFHLEGDDLPGLFLKNGVTSVRDPGEWIETYSLVLESEDTLPRLFLAGPHLDMAPPAYPGDSVIVRDERETRLAVSRSINDGASVIKVYFRLSLDLIRVAVETAHARGIPVTGHLEIVSAADAIEAGIDGIEHVTSCGTSLVSPPEAEAYRQAVLADNDARRDGRYQVWSGINLEHSARADSLLELMASRGVFLSPTLAVFERRAGDPAVTDVQVRAFRNMVKFVGMAHKAGVPVVTGSHASVRYAERGWAYVRELELLIESGLTPMESIVAGTLQNARFFQIDDRLGSIEAGKLADLILIEGNLLEDFSSLHRVQRVMLNGVWVDVTD